MDFGRHVFVFFFSLYPIPSLSRKLGTNKSSPCPWPCPLLSLSGRQILRVKNDADHEAAARADGDVLAVAEVRDSDLEPVAARARVVVDLQRRVVRHVLDLDLVVDVEVVAGGGGRRRCRYARQGGSCSRGCGRGRHLCVCERECVGVDVGV